MRETLGLSLLTLLAIGTALAACERQPLADRGAAPVASEAASAAGTPGDASAEPSARVARWDEALKSAQNIPCRAIAVDGHVGAEAEADAGAPPDALALRGEIPSDVWLSLGPDARLVAKDPRTTRETAFVGPARVRPCVAHREESWVAAGRFESAIGAGETPGAEEWVVTPLAVARYMAAQLRLDVRAKDASVTLGTGVAFLWLADGVRESPLPHRAGDAAPGAATTTVDDDGWLRMTEGTLALAEGAPRSPANAARAAVDRCVTLTKEARDLAGELLAGLATLDAGTAKDQLRTRRIARAACVVAALRVDMLPPSSAKAALSSRLEGARAGAGSPATPPAGRGATP